MLAGSAHLINLHGTCWQLLQERTLEQQHDQHQEQVAVVIGRGCSWRQAQQKGLGAACKHLVGRRVAVWWPNDKKHYEGIVTDYYHSNGCSSKGGVWANIMGRHRVEYDDGEVELLDMTREAWQLTEAELNDLADLQMVPLLAATQQPEVVLVLHLISHANTQATQAVGIAAPSLPPQQLLQEQCSR
eukprot:gene6173-6411_t